MALSSGITGHCSPSWHSTHQCVLTNPETLVPLRELPGHWDLVKIGTVSLRMSHLELDTESQVQLGQCKIITNSDVLFWTYFYYCDIYHLTTNLKANQSWINHRNRELK